MGIRIEIWGFSVRLSTHSFHDSLILPVWAFYHSKTASKAFTAPSINFSTANSNPQRKTHVAFSQQSHKAFSSHTQRQELSKPKQSRAVSGLKQADKRSTLFHLIGLSTQRQCHPSMNLSRRLRTTKRLHLRMESGILSRIISLDSTSPSSWFTWPPMSTAQAWMPGLIQTYKLRGGAEELAIQPMSSDSSSPKSWEDLGTTAMCFRRARMYV